MDIPRIFWRRFLYYIVKIHIMMALLKCLGSGWAASFTLADLGSCGTTDSFLKVGHAERTLRAHQITACALFTPRKQAYEEYLTSCCDDDPPDEAKWYEERANESTHFFSSNLCKFSSTY